MIQRGGLGDADEHAAMGLMASHCPRRMLAPLAARVAASVAPGRSLAARRAPPRRGVRSAGPPALRERRSPTASGSAIGPQCRCGSARRTPGGGPRRPGWPRSPTARTPSRSPRARSGDEAPRRAAPRSTRRRSACSDSAGRRAPPCWAPRLPRAGLEPAAPARHGREAPGPGRRGDWAPGMPDRHSVVPPPPMVVRRSRP